MDGNNDYSRTVEYWQKQIDLATDDLKKYWKRGDAVIKTYLDNRTLTNDGDRNFNLFAANTDILRSALYANVPKVSVSRRYSDSDDDVSRVAAMILERVVQFELDNDRDFDTTARSIVLDRILPGLSVAWVRYDTVTEQREIQITNSVDELTEEEQPETQTVILDESSPIDYVFWKDFLWSPARTWAEVTWVARRVYLCNDEFIDRFGEDVAAIVPLVERATTKSSDIDVVTNEDQAEVYEIWDKTTKTVYWYSRGVSQLLDEKSDPLHLPTFFPTPRPLFANTTTSKLSPVPDYTMVQDQYAELNTLNNRISQLVEACRVVGVYDSQLKQLASVLSAAESQMIPIDGWAGFQQGGGLHGKMDFLPIEATANVLVILQRARETVKNQIYELTGISDVIRGTTNPYETAAAQSMKTQYASMRLSNLQHEIAQFFSDLLALKASIVIKFYDPSTLLARCGVFQQADIPYVQPAIMLLKDSALSTFRLSVSVESLQLPNFDVEKQQRSEALTAISKFLEQAVPAASSMPPLAPMLMQMLRWGVSGYRATKDIEGVLDSGTRAIEQQIMERQNEGQGPSPDQIMLQLKQRQAEADIAFKQDQLRLEAERDNRKFQLEMENLRLRQAEIELERLKLGVNANLTSSANSVEAALQSRALDIKGNTAHVQNLEKLNGAVVRNSPTM